MKPGKDAQPLGYPHFVSTSSRKCSARCPGAGPLICPRKEQACTKEGVRPSATEWLAITLICADTFYIRELPRRGFDSSYGTVHK
jgi:hypothetical protein